MKIKTLLVFIIMVVTVFLIYTFTKDNKIYYVDLGINTNNKSYSYYLKEDIKKKNKLEKYINYFNKEDYRTTDLIRNINDNIKIKDKTIQNVLIKADLITVSIGKNDIYYKLGYTNIDEMYNYVDSILNDIDNLLKLLRKYSKEEIYMIGYYNNYSITYQELFDYTNKRVEDLCKTYNINFIDISNLNNDDFNKNILNESGNKFIYNKIKKDLNY